MRKKMPDGVRDLGQGKYEIRATWTDPSSANRKSFELNVEASSPWVAAEMREQELAKRKAGVARPVAPERRRLDDSLRGWLVRRAVDQGVKSAVRASTMSTYRSCAERWIEDIGGDRFVDSITPAEIVEIMGGWRDAGARTHTINCRLRVLRTWAKQTGNKHVTQDVDGAETTAKEASRLIMRAEYLGEDVGRGLTMKELHDWLYWAPRAEPDWWPLLGTLWITGARLGEVLALKRKRVDPVTGLVRIRESVWHGNAGLPKTRAGIRDTFLVGAPLEAMREWMKLTARRHGGDENALVFPSLTSKHGYVSDTGVRKAQLRIFEMAGVELHERPAIHCLRHTYNNYLRRVADETVRQGMMGHADAAVGRLYSAADIQERIGAQGRAYALMTGGSPPGTVPTGEVVRLLEREAEEEVEGRVESVMREARDVGEKVGDPGVGES